MPSREDFLAILQGADGRAVALLHLLLKRCRHGAPLVQQLTCLEHLGRFVVAGPEIPGAAGHAALTRLEMLVSALERVPAAQRRFQATLLAVTSETRAIKLFGEIGMPND